MNVHILRVSPFLRLAYEPKTKKGLLVWDIAVKKASNLDWNVSSTTDEVGTLWIITKAITCTFVTNQLLVNLRRLPFEVVSMFDALSFDEITPGKMLVH